VLDALEGSEFHRDALVFFINDNGAGGKNGGDNRPYRSGKSRVYDGGVRVPYLARLPGAEPGTYAAMVTSMDVVPTALAAAGVPIPTDLDGVDLLPYVKGERAAPPHAHLFWRSGKDWAVRSERFKLVHDRKEGFGFFDLVADPGEKQDLGLEHPERPALLDAWEAWNAGNVPPAFPSAAEVRRQEKEKKSP